MNFSAITHRAYDEFCYPLNSEELVINIKTGYDVIGVSIVLGDPFSEGILGGSEQWLGEKHELTERKRLKDHQIWSIRVRPEFKRLKYYFELRTENEHYFYAEDGFLTEEEMRSDRRSKQFFIFPWMNESDVATVPLWASETVWYQIFVDRFCNGDPSIDPEGVLPWKEEGEVGGRDFYGGDFQGIISKLDYLEDLGVSGLYLTPINEAKSNHKYETLDYENFDPHFGSKEKFKELVEKSHAHGIRVMLDCVFNHAGHWWEPWQEVLRLGPDSKYFDWFMVKEWPIAEDFTASKKGQMYSFAFIDYMPKLNTNNPEVQEYLISLCENWIREYDVDGLRFDVGNEISHSFLKALRLRVKALKPDIYLMGEIWHNSMPWLRGDEYDSVMNYPLVESIKDFFSDKTKTSLDFEYMVNRCFANYMEQTNSVLFNMLDSHDTRRLRSGVESFEEFVAHHAVNLLMPGSPCIYYGTEIALEGGYDPDCRRCMPWGRISSGEFDDRIQVFKELLRLRREEALLRSNRFIFEELKEESPRLLHFYKVGESGERLEVYINAGEEEILLSTSQKSLFSFGYDNGNLLPYGILIIK